MRAPTLATAELPISFFAKPKQHQRAGSSGNVANPSVERYGGKLRRSGIFVERVSPKHTSEPQRGGIELAAGGYIAPTELEPGARRAGYHKDATPTELVRTVCLAAGGGVNRDLEWTRGGASCLHLRSLARHQSGRMSVEKS